MRNVNYFVTPALLILASIGLFFGFIDTQYAKMNYARADVAQHKDALQKAVELQDKRKVLQEKLSKIGDGNIKKLEKLLPDSVDTVRLIMDLNGVAARYDIPLKMVKLSEESAKKPVVSPLPPQARPTSAAPLKTSEDKLGKIVLSFSVVTSYEKFSDFLKDLEESLRILDVTSISLRASPKDSRLYDFSVIAETYWLK